MNINEFTAKTNDGSKYCQRPRLFCNDGFNMSVQGSAFHYSNPRSTESAYTEMEIGYPSQEDPIIMNWAENEKAPSIYVNRCNSTGN